MGYEVKNAPTSPDLSIFDRPALCGLAKFVKSDLSPEDTELLEAALDSRYSSHAIWLWLSERGFRLTDQVVYRHRTGRCGCRPSRTSHKEAA